MSDTPRTDRHMRGGSYSFSGEFARRLERELTHQTARANEAVRRLAFYADREEAKEISRLRDIIAGQTVELERLRAVLANITAFPARVRAILRHFASVTPP